MEDVKALATQDAMSVNQFLVQAAAEKVASLKARGYLAERAARAAQDADEDQLARGSPVGELRRDVPACHGDQRARDAAHHG